LASIVARTSSRSFDLVTCGSDEQLKVISLVDLRLGHLFESGLGDRSAFVIARRAFRFCGSLDPGWRKQDHERYVFEHLVFIFLNSIADILINALSAFISFPSVSGRFGEKESCRQAAIWLRKFLTELGADANLVCHVRVHAVRA
jgi:hypothetical protein